jgi:aspartate racemase
MFKTAACKLYLGFGYPLPLSLRHFYILGVYRQALKNYVPKVYAGRLIIFLPEGNLRASQIWKKLALRGIEIHEVHGSHAGVLDEPYVKAWAEQLKDQLDRAQSGNPI